MHKTLSVLLPVLLLWSCPDPGPAQEPAPPAGPSAGSLVAHQCTQLARLVLQLLPDTTEHEAEIAQALLQQACRLEPDNAETWRLLAEAAEMAGNDTVLTQALKQYLRLRPDDDVAQLRLIDELAGQKQTVEQRLALFLRMVDSPQARHFSPALRSRLAYRAAMLHSEQADRQAMARRLAQALELDPTNKQAAYQAYTQLVDRGAALDQVAAALFTLHAADPADPATAAMIGDLMLRCGQYASASDWYDAATRLQLKNGGSLSAELGQSVVLALWGAGRVTDALGVIDAMAGKSSSPNPSSQPVPPAGGDATSTAPDRSAPASASNAQAAPTGQASDSAPTETRQLPVDLQMIRLALLDQAGQTQAADALFARLIEQLKILAAQAPDSTALQANVAWTCLLFNRQIPATAVPIIQAVAKAQADKPSPMLKLMQGWLALRQGDTAKASTLLKPLADQDVRARWGLCLMATDAPGEQRFEQLNAVAGMAPASLVGLMAVEQIRSMQRQPAWPADYLQAARPFASVPPVLKQLVDRPLSFVMLREHMAVVRQYTYPQPIDCRLELRNVSNLTLGLGSDGTIPTRLMLFPEARAIGADLPPNIPPVVVDMHRRLRLEPGQALQVPVRLDSGQLGRLLDGLPMQLIRLKVLAMLNPTLSPVGGFRPGVLGTSLSIRGILRQPARLDPENLDQQLTALGGPDNLANFRTIGLLVKAVCIEPDENAQTYTRIRQSLLDGFASMPALRQAWLVSQIIPSDQARQRLKPLLDRAADSPDHLVRFILLTQLAEDPQSPWINASLRSDDPVVRTFATHIRQFAARLQQFRQEQEKARQNAEESGQSAPPAGPGATGPPAPAQTPNSAS